jgi:multicomponent Na+:H+ antiporter subunit F
VSDFLLGCGVLVLLSVAVGLVRVLWGPGDTERIMAAQLLGSGGVAALLLLGTATDLAAATDLALVLVLLAAFASLGFVGGMGQTLARPRMGPDRDPPLECDTSTQRREPETGQGGPRP